ncbi:hypothetical protein DLAC_05034 [Tieghemostelium lacteum]|uniref:Succinate dehydrogenase assembly factor 3 n=1 Tax=Tieghemostelium lacteum TaxID=361077 RepID=A0A151ZI27_TIELA|nr:hypothetical protein DLAC_05034 [Tieghemostelium lacteum]|eukprot:KYQ93651.1 hypothetical protein DLAC_05034 [Tieghemostelium lacteum]
MNNINVLSLYRSILRCHRQLQEPMRSMGDQYVKSEWRLHKKVDIKTRSIFLKQWQQYLTFIELENKRKLKSTLNDNNQEIDETSQFSGKSLSEHEIQNLTKDQLFQLNKLKKETSNLFKD